MAKKYYCFLLVALWAVLSVCTAYAEDIYVTGITKITMRTGPGVDHKIVAMLRSGTKLEIVEYRKDWTQVRTLGGKTGWVLSRFLTPKVPDALVVEKLKKENQNLVRRLKALEDANKDLTLKNASLVQIEEKYNSLKKESADFLKLDAEYKKMLALNNDQKARIRALENDLNNEPKLWFLIGPGVFIVGVFFGLSSRRKKRSSLL
jgi:SH3 domain protein